MFKILVVEDEIALAEETIAAIEKNIPALANVSKLFDLGYSNEQIAEIALEGIEYEAEITDQYIKISTVPDENVESDTAEETAENEETDEEASKDDGPPATLIHLDSNIVDFIDREEMFIVCVKKSYVFIIPKSAFPEDDVQKTREKLSAIMGIRFKIED